MFEVFRQFFLLILSPYLPFVLFSLFFLCRKAPPSFNTGVKGSAVTSGTLMGSGVENTFVMYIEPKHLILVNIVPFL